VFEQLCEPLTAPAPFGQGEGARRASPPLTSVDITSGYALLLLGLMLSLAATAHRPTGGRWAQR